MRIVRSRGRLARLALTASAALLAASCSSSNPQSSAEPPAPGSSAPAAGDVQRLNFQSDKPVVGARVAVTAEGLPAGKEAELQWSTVTGGWVIEDYYHFRGKKYTDSTMSLGRFPIDQDGRLNAQFTIPEDYGGIHDVMAIVDGRTVAQNGIDVTQSFEISAASGPIGTPIELRVKGLGWRTMESTWVVNWDNNTLGWISAASARGSAVARFRAAGPAGDHVIKVYTGWQGQPYLNHEQTPVAHLPRPEFIFRTTSAPPQVESAAAEPYQKQVVPDVEINAANAAVSLTPTQGPVGTQARLEATGLRPGAGLDLVWQTAVGNRVSGEGFEPLDNVIGKVTVGPEGALDVPVTVPEDLGGLHSLALHDGEKILARADLCIAAC